MLLLAPSPIIGVPLVLNGHGFGSVGLCERQLQLHTLGSVRSCPIGPSYCFEVFLVNLVQGGVFKNTHSQDDLSSVVESWDSASLTEDIRRNAWLTRRKTLQTVYRRSRDDFVHGWRVVQDWENNFEKRSVKFRRRGKRTLRTKVASHSLGDCRSGQSPPLLPVSFVYAV